LALPPINATPPQVTGPASQARVAAQRAFFDAALGRAQATAQVQPQVPAQVQAPVLARPAPAIAAPPKAEARFDPNTQPLAPNARPGSIVNIRV
jgi:hypothetical protein